MELPKPGLVALGGVAGAVTRWAALDLADQAAWSLVLVNSSGAFILGVLAHGLLRGHATRRLVVGVGFCGAFTTFSTLAVDIARDLERGAPADALVLLAVSLGAGLVAGAAGMATRRAET